MRCLLATSLLLLLWSPPADAVTLDSPKNGTVLVYQSLAYYPPQAQTPDIAEFIAKRTNPGGQWSWSLDPFCNATFEVESVYDSIIRSDARFRPRNVSIPFKEERNFSCSVTAKDNTRTATVNFTLEVFPQNVTECIFAEGSGVNSSCVISSGACGYPIYAGGFFTYFSTTSSPCTTKPRQTVDRESFKESEMYAVFRISGTKNRYGFDQFFNRVVMVKILDLNDNSPICSPRNFTAEISNFISTSFNCSDADATEINSRMVCGTNSPGFRASMSGNDCVLKLTSALRPEAMSSEMEARVAVHNTAVPSSSQRSAGYKFTFTKQNPSTLHVSSIGIHLSIKENATCGKSNYAGTVLEDAANGTAVSGDPVTAINLDGFAVRFYVANATLASLFKIGASSGVVTRTGASLGVGAGAVMHLPIQFFNDSAFFPNARCVFAVKITRTTTTAATTTTTTTRTTTAATTAATTTPKPNTGPGGAALPIYAIALIAVAAVLCVFLIVVLIVCLCCKKHKVSAE